MATVGALNEQFTGLGCAASADRVDSTQVTGQKACAVFNLESIVILINDRGELHGYTLPKSTWRESIRSAADAPGAGRRARPCASTLCRRSAMEIVRSREGSIGS